ncbi:hypothetical protein PF003_g36037 [Phytophthora fragariae]|nr:hypothetical protein PF003_g36037 [Phytophthora fragariae]
MALVASLTIASACFLCCSGVKAGGGVRAPAWHAATGQEQGSWSFGGMHGVGGGANDCSALLLCAAAASRLVAAPALEHGKVRLASSKVRGRLVACMALVASLTIASACFLCCSGVKAGGGVRARAWQAATGQQQGSWSFSGVHGVGGGANDCSA